MLTDRDDYLGPGLKQLNLGLFSSGLRESRESTYLSMHVRCAIYTQVGSQPGEIPQCSMFYFGTETASLWYMVPKSTPTQ